MDKVALRSVLHFPVMVSNDGVFTGSEQWDLHYDADGTGWQGRSIPNSIGGTELGTFFSSIGPRRMSTTKRSAGIGCGAPPPPPHLPLRRRHHRMPHLFCACRCAAATTAAADGGGLAGEGDDDDEEVFDVQLALALRAVYTRHRHDLTLTQLQKVVTELGGDLSSRRMIKMTIALIKHEESEAVRRRHADDKPTSPDFHDGAHDDFAVGIATGLGVPRDVLRVTSARAGSVIVETSAEAAAAFASSLTDPMKLLVDGCRAGPCAVSDVRVEEPAAAAAPAEAAQAPAEPAPAAPPTAAFPTEVSPTPATPADTSMTEARDDEGAGDAGKPGGAEEAEEGEAEDEETSERRAQLSSLRTVTRLKLSREMLNEQVKTCENKRERRERRMGTNGQESQRRFSTKTLINRQPLPPQQQQVCSDPVSARRASVARAAA